MLKNKKRFSVLYVTIFLSGVLPVYGSHPLDRNALSCAPRGAAPLLTPTAAQGLKKQENRRAKQQRARARKQHTAAEEKAAAALNSPQKAPHFQEGVPRCSGYSALSGADLHTVCRKSPIAPFATLPHEAAAQGFSLFIEQWTQPADQVLLTPASSAERAPPTVPLQDGDSDWEDLGADSSGPF